MLTDAQIANLVVDLYNYSGTSIVKEWDNYDPGSTDGICWAWKRVDNLTYIVLRGSVTALDWLRDFTAIANPFSHDQLGPCHPGFYIGMHELWNEIKLKTQGPWVICGHSLGAGRACILTGIMVLDGQAPLRYVRFGEPKPGFAKLASILSIVPGASYQNGDSHIVDPVTTVPLSLPPEEFVHPTPLIKICSPPGADIIAKLGVFGFHHAPLYAAGVAALSRVSIL